MEYALILEPADQLGGYSIRGARISFSAPDKESAQRFAEAFASAVALHTGDSVRAFARSEPRTPRVTKDTPERRALYRRWHAMIKRCHDPSNEGYRLYGARGITVCDEWRASFDAFRQWSERNGFASGLSLDRVDTLQGYRPDNCRWATQREQANNMRSNVVLRFAGKSQTIAQWARETGLPTGTIEQRIRVLKWPIEKALSTPPRGWGPGHFAK